MEENQYADIDNLISRQNEMLDNSLKQQQDIINRQTALNVSELERNKEEVDKDATKTNKALYTEYKKASNPYGVNAENLATQGLSNSGYAETTQTNLYNTFQKNVTSTLNNARDLKADFDFQISKARQTGDINLAQAALDIYNQRMSLLAQEYELKNNKEQFLYQKSQNALAQSNWEKEFAYQQNRDNVSDSQWQQTFDYQKNRDAVADNQWERQYALSKKASRSSSSSGTTKKNSLNVTDGGGFNMSEFENALQGVYNTAIEYSPKVGDENKQKLAEMAKQRITDTIKTQYQKGNISEKEAEKLFNKYGY